MKNKNITLIIKNNPKEIYDFDSGTYKLEFVNSSYNINNGYFIVETFYDNDSSIIGQVFDIKTIKSYKIWQ